MSNKKQMQNTYVVTLKAKDGELRALREARWQTQGVIIPLFDIPTPTKNKTNAIAAKNKDVNTEYLKDMAERIRKIYTNKNPIMVDMYYWEPEDTIQDKNLSVYEYFHKSYSQIWCTSPFKRRPVSGCFPV